MYEDALARVDLFSRLRFQELTQVAARCREVRYSPGAVLIAQGEKGAGLFIISKGTVRITRKNGSDGAEQVLGTAGTADILGEMALLDDLPRSATVTAVDEVSALVLPFGDFRVILRHILSTEPNAGMELLATLSLRVRKCEQRVYE